MAIQSAIYGNPSRSGDVVNDAVLPVWALGAGDVGAPVKLGAYPDRTVYFFGTFNGGSLALRGSNMEEPDPENDAHWFTLTDPKLSTPLEGVVTNSGFVLYENPLFISPKVTGGDGLTALNVAILGRKKQ